MNQPTEDVTHAPEEATQVSPDETTQSAAVEISTGDPSAALAPETLPQSTQITSGGLPAEALNPSETAAPSDSSSPSDNAAAAEGDVVKKRRRRRRKKAGDATDEATGGAPNTAKPRRDAAQLPFGSFFVGTPARRHSFAVGEDVAGRVEMAADGVYLIDLFGKATAVVDAADSPEVEELPQIPTPLPGHGVIEPVVHSAEADVEASLSAETSEIVSGHRSAVADRGLESTGDEAASTSDAGENPALGDPALGDPALGDPALGDRVDSGSATLDAELSETPGSETPGSETPGTETWVTDDHEVDEVSTDHVEASREPSLPEARIVLEPGAIFRGRIGFVAESGHLAIVNRAVARDEVVQRLEALRSAGRRVWGIVFGFNRGGFDVIVDGLRAFCPASAMALEAIEDPRTLVGKRLVFGLAPMRSGGAGRNDAGRGGEVDLVVTRRPMLERAAWKAARQRLRTMQVGDAVRGKVTEVRDYGLFVDLDGVEGLVHQSELGWKRGLRPSEVAKVGAEIDAQIVKIHPLSRRDRVGKVSLSMRLAQPDPWGVHQQKIREGSAFRGKIVATTDFGAFVEILPGVEGLLHISELGKDLRHASQSVQVGEEVAVVLDRVDRSQRRLSLSKLTAKEAEAIDSSGTSSAQPVSLSPGSRVQVTIERVEHNGMTVQVVGVLGRRGRGYVDNRDLGSFTQAEQRRSLTPGSQVQVKILGTARDGTLNCSLRAREVDDERQAVRDYRREAAKQGFGTFGDLLRSKLSSSAKSEGES